jgi:Tfp pilus assembly protein PilF
LRKPRQHGFDFGPAADHAGARRARRSFRFAVAACLAFTLILWYAERYSSLDLRETQYRMSLTLAPESARPILRNVVRRDREMSETPNAKYVEALAALEEPDQILECYEQAYQLNPTNSFLVINYGSQLYLTGQFQAARERFREASLQPPKNALPRYLEAATLIEAAWRESNGEMPEGLASERLRQALRLIARANESGYPVLFPQPLWHASLPARGQRYADLREAMAKRSMAPLFDLRNRIGALARKAIDQDQAAAWNPWRDELEIMAQHFDGTRKDPKNSPVATQVLFSLLSQKTLSELRIRAAERQGKTPGSLLFERKLLLSNNLAALQGFLDARPAHVEKDLHRLYQPFFLSAGTFLILFFFYGVAFAALRFSHGSRRAWALPHSNLALGTACGGTALLFVLLLVHAVLRLAGGAGGVRMLVVPWGAILGAMILFGLVYPIVCIRREKNNNQAPVDQDSFAAPKGLWRVAAFSLTRRFFGIYIGAFLCALCAWLIVFRFSVGVYPWQFSLLATGMETETLDLLRGIHQNLIAGQGAR